MFVTLHKNTFLGDMFE